MLRYFSIYECFENCHFLLNFQCQLSKSWKKKSLFHIKEGGSTVLFFISKKMF